jgi:hypothetical protein
MSRAERRAYQRMNKNRDPYALPVAPAQKARIERVRARREQKRGGGGTASAFVTRRFLAWAVGGGLLAGLIGFSVAWPNGMPMALYVGLGVAIVWGILATGLRLAQRRAAASQP